MFRLILPTVVSLALLACRPGTNATSTPPDAEAPDQAASEDGFVSVFNGENLSGWIGDTLGYAVEDGVLICKEESGGKLFIDQTFSDFAFRFEFKLEPNSNNGVGIRAELGEDPAYHGMEIQIIDNTGEEWTDIKPYQKHGSVYGVVPARTGFLRPVGEWNEEEIRADSSRITVTLNGVIIVDADIREAAPNGETIDGSEHPGLFNASGYVGFLGHGDRVEFRNIRIKEL